jgi:hypothetical protein
MTRRYRRIPREVDAFCWEGQPRAQWPQWLERAVLLADGTLAVGGVRDAVRRGEWLVLENRYILRLSQAAFESAYEAFEP